MTRKTTVALSSLVPAEVEEKLGRLTELPDEEIGALEEALVEAFKALDRHGDNPPLEEMEAIADAVDAVRAEGKARVEAAEAATPEAVAAAANAAREVVSRPSLSQIAKHIPASARPKFANPRAPMLSTSEGSPLEASDLARLVGQRVTELRSRRQPGRAVIASTHWEYPPDRQLQSGNANENGARIEAVVASLNGQDYEAIVAAGGLCAPVDVLYDVFTVGDARRPIRDALVRMAATRGGVQYTRPPVLRDIPVTGPRASRAAQVYTHAEDAAGNVYPKGVYEIACGNTVEKKVAAVVARGRTGNFLRRFNPELWDANWHLIQVAHARVADNALWESMEANSTAVVTGVDASTELGTARRVLRAIGLAIEGMRSRHRMDDSHAVRLIGPSWLRGNLREDLAAQIPGDNAMAVADATISEFFRARGAVVTWSPDAGGQSFGNQAAGALNPWPDLVQLLLFPEGTHLFLDGGEFVFGLEIRDKTLNDENDVESFTETFEETSIIGPESLSLTVDICASGRSSAAVAYAPCDLGS